MLHDIFITDLFIENAPVIYVREGEIGEEERYPNFYYYDMRHNDTDWAVPVSIEKDVRVNFFGTLVTSIPIPTLTLGPDKDKNHFYRIALHPEECPENKEIQQKIIELLSEI